MRSHHRSESPSEGPHQGSTSPPRPSSQPDSSRRYIALRFTLTATYHETWDEAEDALADLPALRRAAIVDSLTGETFASQANYAGVEAAVSKEVLGIMRREGPIGDLAFKRRLRPE